MRCRLTIEYAGQHIPILRLPTDDTIRASFQQLVNVPRDQPWPPESDGGAILA